MLRNTILEKYKLSLTMMIADGFFKAFSYITEERD